MEASTNRSRLTLNPLAQPFTSTRPPASIPPGGGDDPTNELIFHNLSTYPFHTDDEFQSGLAAILGHPETAASAEEVEQRADLVLKAKCFYFARKNNLASPIDPASYQAWLRARDGSGDLQSSPPAGETTSAVAAPPSHTPPGHSPPQEQPHQPPPPLPTDPAPPQPRYPTTFNHIVDLITRNQPIPGIETIPDIVLGTEHATPNTVPARRKPWESAPASPPQIAAAEDGPQHRSSVTVNDRDIGTTQSVEGGPASEKSLFGGLLGPLKGTQEADDGGKPILLPATTPSWQELAEEGAADQATREGNAPPAAQAA